MSEPQEQYFTLCLPLKVEQWQKDILEKRFEINRRIYNALLKEAVKRYQQMAQTRAYRANREALFLADNQEQRNLLFKERDCLIEKYRLRKFDICRETAKYRKHFKEHTDSPIVQNLAREVWQAVDNLIKGTASQVYEKQPGQLKSLSGKTNRSSIKFRDKCLVWKGLVLPVNQKNFTWYEEQAFKEEIRYCRTKKAVIRGKDRYFLEIVFRGRAPVKTKSESAGTVGLDMGFQKIALVSERDMSIYQLPAKSHQLEKRKKELAQYMERSRRSLNPENYLPDGRIKKESRHWKFSNKYLKARAQYQELCRKQRALQRQAQYELIEEISSIGDCFYIEDISFAKLGRRKPNSVYQMQTNPGGFIKLLEYKLKIQGKRLHRILPFVVKASGFNHVTGTYQRMPVRKTWRMVGGKKVDKNLYSAFLLSNLREDLEAFDVEKCQERYPTFLMAQSRYQERIAS
jgi:hypothetical protein